MKRSFAVAAVLLAVSLVAACEGSVGGSPGGGGGPPDWSTNPPGAGWLPTVTLATDPVDVGLPAAAIDSGGVATVLWSQSGWTAPAMIPADLRLAGVSESAAANTWTAAAAIESTVGAAATDQIGDLQVRAPATGITALWRRAALVNDRVTSARRGVTATWNEDAVALAVPSSASLAFAANDAGVQVAVWTQVVGTVPRLFFSRRELGTSAAWSAPTSTQSTSGPAAELPAVAVDDNGAAMIVWIERDTGIRIRARFLSSTGVLGAESTPDGDTVLDKRRPRVAVINDSDFIVTWERADAPASVRLYGRRNASSGNWLGTVPTRIDSAPESVAQSSLVRAGVGTVIAAWQQGSLVRLARFTAAQGLWTSPVDVSVNLTGQSSAPQLAADGAGNAALVWLQQPLGSIVTNLHFGRVLANSATPQASELLELDSAAVTAPALAMNPAGAAVVSWRQNVAGGSGDEVRVRLLR